MSLNHTRLSASIKKTLDACAKEDTDPEISKNLLANELATAIITEIKSASILYISGLTLSPEDKVKIIGSLNYKIE